MKLELTADKITVYGPKADGGFSIKLDIGEYEKDKVSQAIMMKPDEVVKVTLEQVGGSDEK